MIDLRPIWAPHPYPAPAAGIPAEVISSAPCRCSSPVRSRMGLGRWQRGTHDFLVVLFHHRLQPHKVRWLWLWRPAPSAGRYSLDKEPLATAGYHQH